MTALQELASAPALYAPADRDRKPQRTILSALDLGPDEAQRVFCHFLQGGRESPVTFGDLRRDAAKYAAYLRAQGVQPGEVVLIILPHSPELMAAFLGAMLACAIPSFMPYPSAKQDPAHFWSSHQKLFDRIGSGSLLTYPANVTAIRQNLKLGTWRLLDVSDAANCSDDFAAPASDPDAIAFLQHSSGTTGLKKGVALTHAAVLTQVASYAHRLGLRSDDRVVSWLPLYHDMGLIACFLLPLITHTPVVMLDPFEWVVNPALLFSAIKRHRGTLCWQPNFAFHHLCRTVRPSASLDLSSIRAWINCSEPCRADTFTQFAAKFAPVGVKPDQLQVCYAMAETVFAVTQTNLDAPAPVVIADRSAVQAGRILPASPGAQTHTFLSAGQPIPGLQVQIRHPSGAILPENEIGEIAVSGDCLFHAYFKLPETTAQKLRGGWYFTGDLGFMHDGQLFVTGRTNDLIIVHGRNYYAHELDYLVNQVPGVHPGRAVATGWFRAEVGSEEVVILAEAESGHADLPALTSLIKQTVLNQAGLLPFDVRLVPAGWLIKTTSGKLSRTENLQKYLAERSAA